MAKSDAAQRQQYAVLAPLLIYAALWIVRAAVVAVVLMER